MKSYDGNISDGSRHFHTEGFLNCCKKDEDVHVSANLENKPYPNENKTMIQWGQMDMHLELELECSSSTFIRVPVFIMESTVYK